MRIYLAGPISGKGYEEVVCAYREKASFLQSLGYEVFCPMTGKLYLRNEENLKAYGITVNPVSTDHAIFERDKWMVSQVDIVLSDLSNSGNRVSIGTVMELAWASAWNKHTVSVIPHGNIHEHSFVFEATDIVFQTRDDANNYLKDLIRGIDES